MFITQVALHPSKPDTVFALTTYAVGLLKSTNRGLDWSLANAGIRSYSLYRLAIDPRIAAFRERSPKLDLGHFADLPRLEDVFNGAGVFSDDRTVGAAKLDSIARAQAEEMKGQYRTKSLRHVAQTAPYFHHGSMRTLADVVRFYNDGGGAEGSYPGVKDERLVPLNLTEPEIHDLVAFLEALTGDPVPEELTRNMAAFAPAARLATHIAAD